MDVDGTLLDVKERQMAAFRLALQQDGFQCSHSMLNAYYRKRRNGIPAQVIFEQVGADKKLDQIRVRLLESKKLIASDKPTPGALGILRELRTARVRVVLLSHRRKRGLLKRQLEKVGISPLVDEVLVTRDSPQKESGTGKLRAIRNILQNSSLQPQSCLLVGDTEVDIKTGKALEITTVGVFSGIRSRPLIEMQHPDYVLRSISALTLLIRSCGRWSMEDFARQRRN